jgi:hypothetical protein
MDLRKLEIHPQICWNSADDLSQILEGIATVVVGVTVPWTLPDSPATATFLTQQEKDYIARRLIEDAGTSAGKVHTVEGFKWKYLRAALTEWKLYLAVLIYWGNT